MPRCGRLLVEYLESEEPPDPAAVEGVRRSREADPWGVMGFEHGVVREGAAVDIAHGMECLRRARTASTQHPEPIRE